MNDCEASSSSSEYFTADEEDDSDSLHVSLEPDFLLWLSSDGTRWYLPKYYRPEFDIDFCVSKYEKIIDEFK